MEIFSGRKAKQGKQGVQTVIGEFSFCGLWAIGWSPVVWYFAQ